MRFTLLLLIFVVAGCSSTPTGLSAELPGTAWTLERVVYPDGRVDRGSGERITFQPDGGLLIASCNTCNGTYRMRGDRLFVSDALACTRRACMDTEIELETFFAEDLQLRRDGSYLVIEGETESAAQLLFLPVSDSQVLSSSPAGL